MDLEGTLFDTEGVSWKHITLRARLSKGLATKGEIELRLLH